MFEGIPKRLLNKWNRRLKEAGLPEELDPTRVPLPPESSRDILMRLVPDIDGDAIETFLHLDDSIQKDITDDIEIQKKQAGMTEGKLMARIKFLINQGHELLNMPNEPDNSYQKPLPPDEKNAEQIAAKVAHSIAEIGEKKEQSDEGNPDPFDKSKIH